MVAFDGGKFDSVSLLNKEVEEKDQELQRSKQNQAHDNAHHQQELKYLINEYEGKLKKLQEQNDHLK